MQEIRVPRLGWSMEEGTFVGWLKKTGDSVSVGDPLFELEGEKATQAIESVDAGILHIPSDGPQAGAMVTVGSLLGYLLVPGESASDIPSDRVPAKDFPASQDGGPPATTFSPVTPSSTAVAITPRAKRVAKELGIDIAFVTGSGRGGRIREADVRASRTHVPAEPSHSIPSVDAERPQAISARRRTIAEKLRLSQERTIPVTLSTKFDASNLVSARDQFKATNAPIVPAFTDFVACVATRVLRQHPLLARRWTHDHSALVSPSANGLEIGIAVHTAEGLLVPILRNLEGKFVTEIAEQSRKIIQRARDGKLSASEMQGGFFTITNLGGLGVDGFTPILNYPEIAILGLGAVRREPTVVGDDRIAIRDTMTLSLTFDHAAVDGAPAAEFLQDLAKALTHPTPVLVDAKNR